MAFNIETFKSRAGRNGFLRTNKFELWITVPPILKSGDVNIQDADNNLKFMCDAVNYPGISLNTHDNRRFGYGAVEKKPNAPTFNDLNIDIIADGDNNNWKLIKKWIQYVNNYNFLNSTEPSPGNLSFFEVNYKQNYRSTILLRIYHESGPEEPRTIVKFKDAFPVSISDIQMNWGDTGNLLRFQTSWSYFTWAEVRE
jgi:hypothetical protein